VTHQPAIEIVPYDRSWPLRFAAEAALIHSVFDPATVDVQHIGSTAVPGLGAKAIVDIMLGARTLAEVVDRIPLLRALGYEYVPSLESAFPERRFFAKPSLSAPEVHVHAVERSSRFWQQHLQFRDALRSDPGVAARYFALKTDLAVHYGNERDRYSAAKAAFIESVLTNARSSAV